MREFCSRQRSITLVPIAPRVLQENSPQIPTTRKGQVRVEMELKLQKASLCGIRSIVVRAGDFFGPVPAIVG